MSIEFFLRLLGALAGGVAAYYWGWNLGGRASEDQRIVASLAISLVAAGLGLLLTPYVTTRPFGWLRRQVEHMSVPLLLAAVVGLILGLIVSALLAVPLSLLPGVFGRVLPFLATLLFAYLGIATMVLRQRDISAFLGGALKTPPETSSLNGGRVLLDTSAIIDGRIGDIGQTGFLSATLLVPRFVLDELQRIADSPDVLRRNRGRRGLDMLNKLQKEAVVPLEIVDADADGAGEVDSKLVKMAKQLRCPIVTNDFNLNKVAALQGVRVLNINELANAVKSVVLPGEEMAVYILQEGKEVGQGVGYLDDGTMVVVENGRKYINSELEVVVTRVLQTVAGRMIFAQPKAQ